MSAVQIVRCPNCGSFAERQLLNDRPVFPQDQVVRTECPACDYFMVMGLSTGRVIEAYAPGQSAPASQRSMRSRRLIPTHTLVHIQ